MDPVHFNLQFAEYIMLSVDWIRSAVLSDAGGSVNDRRDIIDYSNGISRMYPVKQAWNHLRACMYLAKRKDKPEIFKDTYK